MTDTTRFRAHPTLKESTPSFGGPFAKPVRMKTRLFVAFTGVLFPPSRQARIPQHIAQITTSRTTRLVTTAMLVRTLT